MGTKYFIAPSIAIWWFTLSIQETNQWATGCSLSLHDGKKNIPDYQSSPDTLFLLHGRSLEETLMHLTVYVVQSTIDGTMKYFALPIGLYPNFFLVGFPHISTAALSRNNIFQITAFYLNIIYSCDQRYIFSIITPVFSVTFRNYSNMLICCSRNICTYYYYQYLKQLRISFLDSLMNRKIQRSAFI